MISAFRSGPAGQHGPLRMLLPVFASLAACSGPPVADPAPGAAPPLFTDAHAGVRVDNQGPQEILRSAPLSDGAARLFEANALEVQSGDRVIVETGAGLLSARSVREFSLAPVSPHEALIERLDSAGTYVAGIGAVRGTNDGFLGQLLNTGWVATGAQGAVAFAFALAPEVLLFDSDGEQLWHSVRPRPLPAPEPKLTRSGSSIRPEFIEQQHGLALGPDGRFYVLAGATLDSVRVDVIDHDGVYLRTGRFPRGQEIYVDDRGGVASAAPGEASGLEAVVGAGDHAAAASNTSGAGAGSIARDRPPHPDIDLPALMGPGRVTLTAYRGKAVIINAWASWCAPCRIEMPKLDSLAVAGDTSAFVIVGLNEDVDSDRGRAFVESLGGVAYPLGIGGGRLQGTLGYRGLPYTVVLDRQHRIVSTIHGFGSTLDPVLQALETAIGGS